MFMVNSDGGWCGVPNQTKNQCRAVCVASLNHTMDRDFMYVQYLVGVSI